MAKRKKLNKRVVILIAAMSGVVALAVVGALLRSPAEDPVLAMRQGDEAFERGDYGTAAKAFVVAIQNLPEGEAGDATFKLSRTFLNWGQDPDLTKSVRSEYIERGLRNLQSALALAPRHLGARRLTCEISFARARRDGRLWNVYIRHATELLEIADDDAETYYQRGFANGFLGRTLGGEYITQAVADFRKAAELKPEDPRYWIGLCGFLRNPMVDQFAEAEKGYTQGIEANPDSAELRVQYAEYLREAGRKDEALVQLQEAIKRQAESTVGKIALADYYSKEGKPAEAIRELEAAKAIDDSDHRIYHNLVLVHRQQIRHGDSDKVRLARSQEAVQASRDGLDIVNKRMQPTVDGPPVSDLDRRRLADARWKLNYLLANVLMDMTAISTVDMKAVVDEAKECVSRLDRLIPNTPQRHKIAGRIAQAEGDLTEAVRLLELARRGFGFDPETTGILINIYRRQDLPGMSEGLIDDFLARPGAVPSEDILLEKVRLLMRRYEFEEAERLVKTRVLEKNPGSAAAQNMMLTLRMLQGKPPEVPPDLAPSRMVIRLVLDRAAVLWIEDRRDKAIEVVEKLYHAVANNTPDDVSSKMRVVTRLMGFYVATKKNLKAIDLLDTLVRQHPDRKDLQLQRKMLDEPDRAKQIEVRLGMAKDLPPLERALEQANTYLVFGDEKNYLAQLQEAAKIDPNAPGVVEGMFRSALATRDWTVAQECLDRAAKGNADGVGGQVYSARLAMAQEKYAEAVQMLTDLTEKHRGMKSAWIMLGDCYFKTGEFEKAYDTYRGVYKLDPSYVPAQIGLAKSCDALGRRRESLVYALKAYKTSEGRLDKFITHIVLLEEAKDASSGDIAHIQEIIRRRERIRERTPQDLENRLHLGRLYEEASELKSAETEYVYIYRTTSNRIGGAKIYTDFLSRTRQSGKAEQIFEELIESEKDKVGALLLYARHLARHSAEQAYNTYKRAIEMDTKDPRGYREVAGFLAERMTNYPAAADAMGMYCKLRPTHIPARKQWIHYTIEAKRFEEATQRLNLILAADPSDAQTLTLKGFLLMRQENLDGAEKLLLQAIKEDPGSPYAYLYLTKIALERGDVEAARTWLQAVTKLTDSPDVLIQLALVYVRLGEYNSAQATLRAILDQREDHVAAIRLLLSLYQRGKKWDRMERLLQHAQEKFPGEVGYRLQEIEMLRSRGMVELAVMKAEEARRLAPESWPVLGTYLAALLVAKEYEKVVAVSEPHLEGHEQSALIKAYRGSALVGMKKTAEADAMFRESMATVSADNIQYVARQAEKAFGRAPATKKLALWSSVRADEWQTGRMLGDVYLRGRQYEKALSHLTRSLGQAKQEKDKALIHRMLGAVHHSVGVTDKQHLPEAEKHYRAAIALLPGDRESLNNLAYLYANDMGRAAEALVLVEKVYKLDPNEARIADTYGWTLAKLGRYDLAKEVLQRSIQLGEPMAANRYHLGWVYEQTEQFANATNSYRQGLELVRDDPDDPLHRLLTEGLKRAESKTRPKE